MKRIKSLAIFGLIVTGALALIAGSQTWISFMIEGVHSLETVTGHDVNSALSPISLAVIAAALALTIAGKVFRIVLGVLVALLGAGITALTVTVLSAPVDALSASITALTGLAGGAAATGVTWMQVSGWAVACAVIGVLIALVGLLVVVTGAKWVTGGRKYDSSATAAGAKGGEPDRISDWDALSEGDDPSENFR